MFPRNISVRGWAGLKVPEFSGIAEAVRSAWELTRPVTSSLPALLTGAVALAGAGISPGTVIRACIAMGLTAMAGFVFDNIFDVPADRLTDQPTPLTQGRISVLQARVIAAVLAISAIVLSPDGAAGRLTVSATLLALWFYSPAAQAAPWLKNLYSALLVCVPLFYGARMAGIAPPLGFYLALGLFALGRESLIDVHQVEADRKARFKTVAILAGRSATEICATIMIVLAGALLVFLSSGTAARLASVLCVATIFGVLSTSRPAVRRTGLLRIPMAIAVVAIGLSLAVSASVSASLSFR